MALKPAAEFGFPGTSGPDLELPGAAGLLEPLLRRFAGDGPTNLMRAKTEVHAALRENGGVVPAAPPLADGLPPEAIPSIAYGRSDARILAEIDQDGFAFSVDPVDAGFFDRRARRKQRQQNLLDVALIDGRVCIRKRIRRLRMGARLWGNRPVPPKWWAYRGLWATLGLYLYSEAAALLRLRDLPFVPKLRAIDLEDRALYIDYIQGENLRNQAARGGAAVHDVDLGANASLGRLTARELERREVAILDRIGGAGDFRAEIAAMAREINARGVAPLDIKLGNFIRGAVSGRLYWFDFEICRLQSQPRWEADLALQRELLEELFQLSSRGHTVM